MHPTNVSSDGHLHTCVLFSDYLTFLLIRSLLTHYSDLVSFGDKRQELEVYFFSLSKCIAQLSAVLVYHSQYTHSIHYIGIVYFSTLSKCIAQFCTICICPLQCTARESKIFHIQSFC